MRGDFRELMTTREFRAASGRTVVIEFSPDGTVRGVAIKDEEARVHLHLHPSDARHLAGLIMEFLP